MMDTANDPHTETDNRLVHRLIFEGECLPGFDKDAMRHALAGHLQRAPRTLFTGKPVVIKDGLSEAEAALAKEELEALGAQVTVDVVESPPPMGPLTLLDVAVPTPTGQPKPSVQPVMNASMRIASQDAEAFPTLQTITPDDLATAAKQRPQKADAERFVSEDAVQENLTGVDALKPPPAEAPAATPDSAGSKNQNSATVKANPSPADEPGPSVTCPNCKERQTMQLLCRACGSNLKSALEAQQEVLAQQRATRVRTATPDRTALEPEKGTRILGFVVPETVADQFTLANGLRTVFVLLAVLLVLGFVWSQLRPAPVVLSTAPAPQAAVAVNVPASDSVTSEEAAAEVPPPPSEQDVVARLKQAGPSVAAFRQSYWPKKGSKVFVISGDTTWTWRAEMPSVTRALAEAMSECENLRLPDAPPCKVVSVNNFWQD